METEHVPDEQTHKKGRHRKKLLYNSILQQMEFYFSDSNLTKDRMLSQLTENDSYVDVEIFLRFNKIRKLTDSIEDITKAISKSELIELSEDRTQVRRKEPVKIKEDVDECTVYVERLKSDATHDWLTTIFSEFGRVVYVSIPKYKHSGMIKGFAFVEFENEEGAKAALEYFESIDCKIPSYMEPLKLQSIITYEGDKTNANDEVSERNGDENEDEPKQNLKRKHSDVQEDKVEKKAKLTDNNEEANIENESAEIEKVISEEKSESKRKRKLSGEISEDTGDAKETKKRKAKLDDEIETTKVEHDMLLEEKKKKKSKKSHRKKVNLKEIGLQILSKKEWKKMRNRYLDMQRKTMKELKMHLNRQRFGNRFESHKRPHFEAQKPVKVEVSQECEKETPLKFTTGIIVKICLSEPCFENKKLKNEIKASSSDIQFVDIPLAAGSEEVYVRFTEPSHAKTFSGSNLRGKCCVLEGDEETEYWKKIEASRTAKQKRAGGKQRGRDKLLKKAEKQISKHVRFDDSE